MLRDLFKHMSEFDLSFFSNSTASQFVRHFLLKGTLQDIEVLQKRLRRLLGDLTFLEAFILSGTTFTMFMMFNLCHSTNSRQAAMPCTVAQLVCLTMRAVLLACPDQAQCCMTLQITRLGQCHESIVHITVLSQCHIARFLLLHQL